MKRIVLLPIASIFLSVFMFSCGGNEEPSIVKKWNVPYIFLREQEVEVPLEDAYIIFNADSTFEEVNVEATEASGSWLLNQEAKTLQLFDATAQEGVSLDYKIEKFTNDSIILIKEADGEGGLRKEYLLIAEQKPEE